MVERYSMADKLGGMSDEQAEQVLAAQKRKISVEHGFCCWGAYRKHTGKERTSWKK